MLYPESRVWAKLELCLRRCHWVHPNTRQQTQVRIGAVNN